MQWHAPESAEKSHARSAGSRKNQGARKLPHKCQNGSSGNEHGNGGGGRDRTGVHGFAGHPSIALNQSLRDFYFSPFSKLTCFVPKKFWACMHVERLSVRRESYLSLPSMLGFGGCKCTDSKKITFAYRTEIFSGRRWRSAVAHCQQLRCIESLGRLNH